MASFGSSLAGAGLNHVPARVRLDETVQAGAARARRSADSGDETYADRHFGAQRFELPCDLGPSLSAYDERGASSLSAARSERPKGVLTAAARLCNIDRWNVVTIGC